MRTTQPTPVIVGGISENCVVDGILEKFSAATRQWFTAHFSKATDAQIGAWKAISTGLHTLVVAPTGSGKTLAAFLWAIDQLSFGGDHSTTPANSLARTKVLYISPLKALAVDVERNLRIPLAGITETSQELGKERRAISVGVRSGDSSASERRALLKNPPDILITTPESLFLMLTSAARETLRNVTTVIIDEVHAVAATKRGSHLALSLERLDALLRQPAQRIGLSATVNPHEKVARFLAGGLPVTIVAPPSGKKFDLTVVVPCDEMSELKKTPENSLWPQIENSIVDRILEQQSCIVFANSRRLAERLTARLNEIYAERIAEPDIPLETPTRTSLPAQIMAQSGASAGIEPLLARAHHGSVSKEQRSLIEEDLKSGRLRCVVATSSLELGIDMGAVDLVIQVEAPFSVASGLQRIGRAGHQVDRISRGVIYPKNRTDLIHCAVTAQRMTQGLIESISLITNPLDVLAQQTIAACSMDTLTVDGWFELIKRSAPFSNIPRSAYEAILDLLAGRYPSDEFAHLRPRIIWNRETGQLSAKPGSKRLAVTNGGTIPDRGLFGVFMLGDTASRVGELDEEMVYESRVGDVFALGSTSWKIQEITHDRVLVSPVFGEPARLPFWKGDGVGRSAELGKAIGEFTRKIADLPKKEQEELLRTAQLDQKARANVVSFIKEQKTATQSVPSDTTLIVERFLDELGDWRIILHSPYGMRIHAPWALAVKARIRDRLGIDAEIFSSDDGIVLRLPHSEKEPPGVELFVFEAEQIEHLVTTEVGNSALFAGRFRESAARALLLPRQNPAKRSPLWQQRHRSAQLLAVAQKYPRFPLIVETIRECLTDVYDLPGLVTLLQEQRRQKIHFLEIETQHPSPFAQSLLFGYLASFIYSEDSPLAEKRAAALSIDPTFLAELLGRTELHELLNPAIITKTEQELQCKTPERKLIGSEGVADLLRILGPLSTAELKERLSENSSAKKYLRQLLAEKRVFSFQRAGKKYWAVSEDASRIRDGLGLKGAENLPAIFHEPVADPLGDLLGRDARRHGPFTTEEIATRWGISEKLALKTLRSLEKNGRLVEGTFRSAANTSGSEWCDLDVLQQLRGRSLAALRRESEPVNHSTFARFLPDWQRVNGALTGVDGVLAVCEQLAGFPIAASAWETLVFPARVADYQPSMLDALTLSGEVLFSGSGSLGNNDGWLAFHPAETTALSRREPEKQELSNAEYAIIDILQKGGAFFFSNICEMLQKSGEIIAFNEEELAIALWNLFWSGLITNDTMTPVRELMEFGRSSRPLNRQTPRSRNYRGRIALSPRRKNPPTSIRVAGRWSLLPPLEKDPTLRAHHAAELLLDRYGIVTKGSVRNEKTTGGFAFSYRVLSRFEDFDRCRRGYFVDGLGAAQFAEPQTIDRLRLLAREHSDSTFVEQKSAVTLAASDPANPFGAALPWPESPGHRPSRKAGALVVIVNGILTLYVERGAANVLCFSSEELLLAEAAKSLAKTVKNGWINQIRIEKVNGEFVLGTALGKALEQSGFAAIPQGLRLRSS